MVKNLIKFFLLLQYQFLTELTNIKTKISDICVVPIMKQLCNPLYEMSY
jgi:hypothetical protein